MPEININVRDKCAEGEGVVICNNSDYAVVWDLDEEWTPYDAKTMRVNLADGTYQDVVFTGDTATLPVLTASGWVSVGLYAGDIHTSRASRLLALSSVLTPGGSPAAPAEDVYAQIMAKLNELSTVSPEDIAKAVEDYLTEHPAASASMRVEGGYIQFSGDGETWENVIALADLKGPKGDTGAGMDITGATVGQIARISAVDDNGVPTEWEPADTSFVQAAEGEYQQQPNFTSALNTADPDFKPNTRLNGSGGESTDVRTYTMWTSSYIGCKAGDVIRVRCPDGTFESGGGSIWPIAVQYNATKVSTGAVTYKATSGTSYDAVFDSDGKGFSITINDLSVAFIRIVGNGDAAGAIITKNQEITYKQVWVGTPMQFGDEVKQNMANVFVQAPDGTLYTIAVDNSGNLSAKAFTQ